jgi:hypothetical protein
VNSLTVFSQGGTDRLDIGTASAFYRAQRTP